MSDLTATCASAGCPTCRADTAEAALADLRAKVEALADLTEGPSREGTAKWSDRDRDIYSLAIEEARAVLEGGR